MTTAHTPGPWYFEQVGSPGYFIVKGPGLKPLPETVENARLQSAAPDLLAAARFSYDVQCSNGMGDDDDARALYAAICKATGVTP